MYKNVYFGREKWIKSYLNDFSLFYQINIALSDRFIQV